MKKVIYAILICIIIAGIIVVATIGFNVSLTYSKNLEIDIYIGSSFEKSDIKDIVKEVFDTNNIIIQEIELFEDMVSIKIPDTLDEDELTSKVEELNEKINEKYEIENTVDDIDVTHNPKVRLSSLITPYILTLTISLVVILIFVAIRYRKLGALKTVGQYILYTVGVEVLLMSIIAITRIPVGRAIIPVGLTFLIAVLTVLGIKNEKKLVEVPEGNSKNK